MKIYQIELLNDAIFDDESFKPSNPNYTGYRTSYCFPTYAEALGCAVEYAAEPTSFTTNTWVESGYEARQLLEKNFVIRIFKVDPELLLYVINGQCSTGDDGKRLLEIILDSYPAEEIWGTPKELATLEVWRNTGFIPDSAPRHYVQPERSENFGERKFTLCAPTVDSNYDGTQ